MADLVATCVWRISPALIAALDEHFGDPVDAYVNGSQTWLRDDGPDGAALEWRLHPVAGYQRPTSVESHYDVFPAVALAVAQAPPPDGDDRDEDLVPSRFWDGLEAFPVDGDEVEPVPLAAAVTEALGIAPGATGLVDHDAIGEAWERSGGGVSVVALLLDQLRPSPAG